MLRLFILFIAIGAGGAAAWVATSMTSPPTPPTVILPDPVPEAEVLVAAGPLQPGVLITQDDMRWQAWPAHALTDGFIVRSDQPDAPDGFVGQVTQVDLFAGEPIRAEKLATARGGLLSSMLEPGKRAVAVRISAESTAGGFIVPNDRVDVLRTFSRQGATGQTQMQSETLLRNVRVLAIDQSTDTRSNDTVLGKTATLELEAEEVEIIVAGEASGLLSLALRSFADNDDEARIVAAPAEKPAVRIFRGGVMEQVTQR